MSLVQLKEWLDTVRSIPTTAVEDVSEICFNLAEQIERAIDGFEISEDDYE